MKERKIEEILSVILAQEIQEQEPVIFIPSPGNGGDALISYQAYQILSKLKLKFTSVQLGRGIPYLEGRTVIIGGGGGLVPHYKIFPALLERAAQTAKKVVVLPQSILGLEDLLASLNPNVYLFVRDQKSLEHARVFAKNANIYVSEDLALSIDVQKLKIMRPSSFKYLRHQLSISKYHFRIATQRNLSWLLLLVKTRLRLIFSKDRILFSIRSDIEATIEPPKNHCNIDISSVLEYNDMSEIGAEITAYRMLSFIEMHRTVVTNRLHVGIGAHLLGIETRLLDNSYGKIGAVYQHSLTSNKKIKLIDNISSYDI